MFAQKIVECYPAYKYVWTKDSFENIFFSDRPGGAASHADDPFPTDLMALLNLGLNSLPWHGWIALHQKQTGKRSGEESWAPGLCEVSKPRTQERHNRQKCWIMYCCGAVGFCLDDHVNFQSLVKILTLSNLQTCLNNCKTLTGNDNKIDISLFWVKLLIVFQTNLNCQRKFSQRTISIRDLYAIENCSETPMLYQVGTANYIFPSFWFGLFEIIHEHSP